MALTALSTLIINGTEFQFMKDDEAEKLSLSVSIPDWQVQTTVGKGSKKIVTGYVPRSFSKRAFSSLDDYMDPEMPVKFLLAAVDQNLEGLRGFVGKTGIRDLRHDESKGIPAMVQDEETNAITVSNITSLIQVIKKEFDSLTPAAGSMADPDLEVKKIFAKSAKFEDLNYEDPAAVVLAVIEERRKDLDRLAAKAIEVDPATFKTYCQDKFLANGVSEDGMLMLKGKKDKED